MKTLDELIIDNIKEMIEKDGSTTYEQWREEQVRKIDLEIQLRKLTEHIHTQEELEWCIEVLEMAQKGTLYRLIYKNE